MPKTTLSFEEALGKLEAIVARLEEGKVPLEQSVALYEEATKLKGYCEKILSQAEQKIQRIVSKDPQTPGAIEVQDMEIPTPNKEKPNNGLL